MAQSSDLGNAPLAVRLLDERVVVWRSGDQVAAFYDLCIHRGTPLSMGWVAGGQLVCPYHGWHYAPSGACTRIPSLPADRGIPARARAKRYHADERYGFVWVCLEDPHAAIPEFPPEWDDPEYTWYVFTPEETLKANAARWVENLLDFSHFAYVHPGVLGDPERPECQPFDVAVGEDCLEYELQVPVAVVDPDGPQEHQHFSVKLPFLVKLVRSQPGIEERLINMWIMAPVSSRETKFYRLRGTNAHPPSPPEEHLKFTHVVYEQDRRIVEAQRPEELPLDLHEELHIRGPDQMGIEYRRLLQRIGVEWR